MTSYGLKLNHGFFVFWLETATTVHNHNGECVPTTNAKRKVRHTVVFKLQVWHRHFRHDGACCSKRIVPLAYHVLCGALWHANTKQDKVYTSRLEDRE